MGCGFISIRMDKTKKKLLLLHEIYITDSFYVKFNLEFIDKYLQRLSRKDYDPKTIIY